jgi:chemotaxis protein CheX
MQMDKYVLPVIQVCKKIFKDFLKLDITDQSPYSFEKEIKGEWDISSMISFTGEARGTIVLSMKKEDACMVTGLLVGHTPNDINADVCDTMGEIANIICGNAKMRMESSSRMEISLPTIIYGQEHIVRWSEDNYDDVPAEGRMFTCIPFRLPNGTKFLLSLAFG